MFFGQAALEALFMLPLVLPPVVTGFLLLLIIGRQGPLGRFLYDALGLQLIFTPYAAVLGRRRRSLSKHDRFQSQGAFIVLTIKEKAMRPAHSEPLKHAFFTITLPLAKSGLVAGLVLSFARALGEFGATIMIAGNIPGKTQTLPLAIYFASEANNLTQAGGYVLLISVLTFTLIFGLNRWNGNSVRRGEGLF